MAGLAISGSLFQHLHTCLRLGLEEQLLKRWARHGINGGCTAGFAAPPVAIAAWEAVIHELLLSPFPRCMHHQNPLWKLPEDMIRKWSVIQKTLLVPEFLFGTTFDKGKPPFQDLEHLVKIRDEFVHFKHTTDIPVKKSTVNYVEEKGLLLTFPRPPNIPADAECDYPWPFKFAGTEMIRWAINTVAAMVRELERIGGDKLPYPISGNFQPVSEATVREWYRTHDIDLNAQR